MVFTIPMSGHVNPLWPILNEFIKTGDYEISVFMDEKNKSKVETLGANFKPIIDNFEPFIDIHKPNKPFNFNVFLKSFFDITKDNLEFVCSEIDKDQPDLIIFDMLCMHFRWIASYYNHYYNLSRSSNELEKFKFCPKNPFPKTVCLSTTIVAEQKLDNEKTEIIEKKSSNDDIRILLNDLFGFEINNNFDQFYIPEFVKKIFISTIPEMQANLDIFDKKKYRFLGSTIDDNLSDPRAKEELFKNILEDNDFKLIYAALGTVFNNTVSVYKTIIESFKYFDHEPEVSRHPSLRLNNLKFIVALGEYVYGEINEMIKNKTFEIPDNIILVKFAPQMDILKKASLFITHGGMNSTSESIHFGGKRYIHLTDRLYFILFF